MGKILGCILSAFLLLTASSCTGNAYGNGQVPSSTQRDGTASSGGAGKKIKLSVGGNEAVVSLDGNAAAEELASMLPLTLSFDEYNNTEKVAHLEQPLPVEQSPDGYGPKEGDFAYYAPWGNLCVFYKDFSYSARLVYLGKFESGLEHFAGAGDGFEVTITLFDG